MYYNHTTIGQNVYGYRCIIIRKYTSKIRHWPILQHSSTINSSGNKIHCTYRSQYDNNILYVIGHLVDLDRFIVYILAVVVCEMISTVQYNDTHQHCTSPPPPKGKYLKYLTFVDDRCCWILIDNVIYSLDIPTISLTAV